MRAPWILTDEHHAHAMAGYAVIGYLQGFAIESLSLEADDSAWAAGVQAVGPILPGSGAISAEREKRTARALIRALLAAPAALERYGFGSAGGALDLADEEIANQPMVWEAIALAGRIAGNGRAVLPHAWREVARAIDDPYIWNAIAALADALVAKRKLLAVEISAILLPRLEQATLPEWADSLPSP